MEIKKNSVDSAKEKKKELSTILLIFIGTYASVHVHKLSVLMFALHNGWWQVQASVCAGDINLNITKNVLMKNDWPLSDLFFRANVLTWLTTNSVSYLEKIIYVNFWSSWYDLFWVSTKRRPKTEDRRSKTEDRKTKSSLILGLSNSGSCNQAKVLYGRYHTRNRLGLRFVV